MVDAKRARAPGFGAVLSFALVKAVLEPAPLNDAELLLPTLRAPEPPTTCPCCTYPALGAARTPEGEWTWNCFGGCNP